MSFTLKTQLIAFATGFYAHDAIKQKCLTLQNTYNANVNLILWLCWIDSNRIHISPSTLDEALQIADGSSQDILKNLRVIRHQLSDSQQFTRVQEQMVVKHLLAAELAIEKVVLQRLQDFTSRLTSVNSEEECLSLFDYLNRFKIENSGQTAIFFLEESRQFGFNLEALGQETSTP